MASITIPGYCDSARAAPSRLTTYFGAELDQPLALGGWTARSVYVNDLRLENGRPPTDGFRIVDRALLSLRAHARAAAERMLMAPDGMDSHRPHVTGGGWIAPGSSVTFYVARCAERSLKFLCANVYPGRDAARPRV